MGISTHFRFGYFRLSLLVILFFLFPVCFSSFQDRDEDTGPKASPTDLNEGPRIAILIPFIGESLPTYFPLFAHTAAGSASLIDFFIIHSGIPSHLLPSLNEQKQYPNVKLIDLQNTQRMANFLLRVTDNRQENLEIPYGELLHVLSQHIERYPYVLVEFKLAYGHIFQDFLSGYTHWGYSDLDIVFGDLPRWISRDELEDFDIVTYSFGDQDRLYLRGQFTFLKNTNRLNQLWRGCSYLSELDGRFARVLQGKEQLSFESAVRFSISLNIIHPFFYIHFSPKRMLHFIPTKNHTIVYGGKTIGRMLFTGCVATK